MLESVVNLTELSKKLAVKAFLAFKFPKNDREAEANAESYVFSLQIATRGSSV